MIKVEKIAHLTGHNGAIYCLAHYKENRFFSAGFDNVVIEWDIRDTSKAVAIAKLNSKAISLCYVADKNWLIAGQSTGGVHIIDLAQKKEIHLLQAHEEMVFALCYSAKHNRLYVGASDGKISVWDLDTMKVLIIKDFGFEKVREIILRGNRLFVGFGDGGIVEMSLELEIFLKVDAHLPGFSVNTIFADENRILTGSRDGHINELKISGGAYTLLQRIPAHNYAIYKIAMSTDEKYIATASRDKSIKIWDAYSLTFILKIDFKSNKSHIASVNNLIWIENYLISASDDRSVIIWEILS